MRWITMIGVGVVAALCMVFAPAALAKSVPRARSAPIEGHRHRGFDHSESTNWAGYAAYGTTFSSVQGDWVQPAARCGATHGQKLKIAAFWVGLDGYEDNTVEQIGTEADCEGSATRSYAWWELYPKSSVLIDEPLKPGDVMHAEVTNDELVLEDRTANWTFREAYSPASLAFESAEWIAEAPAKNALSDFGSVHFSSASASSEALTGGAIESSAWGDDAITLTTGSPAHPTVLATPSELEEEGHAFTITESEAALAEGHGHGYGHGKGHGH